MINMVIVLLVIISFWSFLIYMTIDGYFSESNLWVTFQVWAGVSFLLYAISGFTDGVIACFTSSIILGVIIFPHFIIEKIKEFRDSKDFK